MANSPSEPKPLVFTDAAPAAAPAQGSGPKAISFGAETPSTVPAAAPPPVPTAVPASTSRTRAPGVLSFPENMPSLREVEQVRPLFAPDEHPAMRTAVATAQRMFSDMYRREAYRMDVHFRKLLPVRTETVLTWAEKHLARSPELSLQAAGLIQQFSKLEVAALLDEALESTKSPTGFLQKLLQRQRAPAEFLLLLRDAGAAMDRIREEAEKRSRETSEFADNLTVELCSLVVIADVAGQAPNAALDEALVRRRGMIQQAIQQAGLSILQLAELRRQAVDLSGQISSFITVTLPAIAMADAQTQAQKNS